MQAQFASLSALLAAPADDLVKVKGIGETTRAYHKASAELNSPAAREQITRRPVISSWWALLAYVRQQMQPEKREAFRVLFLDRKNQLIADELLGPAPSPPRPSIPAKSPDGRWKPRL